MACSAACALCVEAGASVALYRHLPPSLLGISHLLALPLVLLASASLFCFVALVAVVAFLVPPLAGPRFSRSVSAAGSRGTTRQERRPQRLSCVLPLLPARVRQRLKKMPHLGGQVRGHLDGICCRLLFEVRPMLELAEDLSFVRFARVKHIISIRKNTRFESLGAEEPLK